MTPLPSPFVAVHAVRVEEVDAAGIVFFARYFAWCHEAMAEMLDGVSGGYAGLILRRGVGLPTVHAEADYVAPLRFGDAVAIVTTVDAIGTSSCTLRFRLLRADDRRAAAEGAGTLAATVRHVVAFTDLRALEARPLPDDLRRIFERHRV